MILYEFKKYGVVQKYSLIVSVKKKNICLLAIHCFSVCILSVFVYLYLSSNTCPVKFSLVAGDSVPDVGSTSLLYYQTSLVEVSYHLVYLLCHHSLRLFPCYTQAPGLHYTEVKLNSTSSSGIKTSA